MASHLPSSILSGLVPSCLPSTSSSGASIARSTIKPPSRAVSLRIRNVVCESTQEEKSLLAPPNHSPHAKLPVYHIFGCLDTGERACVHVHGALPYIVLRMGGAYTDRLAAAIERRVNELIGEELTKEAERRKKKGGATGGGGASEQGNFQAPPIGRAYVVRTEHVVGRSIYGYHEDEEDFVKVYFTSSFYHAKASAALSSLCSRRALFQPFEAHLPAQLQFWMDSSIYGCEYVSVRGARFRIGQFADQETTVYAGLKVSDILDDVELLSPFYPQTSAAIEVDVMAENIINQELLKKNEYSTNPGLDAIWCEAALRSGGQPVVDTFSKCCAENRPSTDFEAEREHFKRLRRLAKEMKARGMDGGVAGGCTQGLDDTFNLSYMDNEEEDDSHLIDSWASQLDETLVEEENDEEETGNREEHGKEDENCEDEENEDEEESDSNLMDQTLCEVASDEHQKDSDFSAQEDEPMMTDRIDREYDVDVVPESPLLDNSDEHLDIEEVFAASPHPEYGETVRTPVAIKTSKRPRHPKEERGAEWLTLRKRPPACTAFSPPLHLPTAKATARAGIGDQNALECGSSHSTELATTCSPEGGAVSVSPSQQTGERSIYHHFDSSSVELNSQDLLRKRSQEAAVDGEEIVGEIRHISVVSLELSTVTGQIYPDPAEAKIVAAAVVAYSDVCRVSTPTAEVVFLVGEKPQGLNQEECTLAYLVQTEDELIEAVIEFVQRFDPDMLAGYDTSRLSWGYLRKRATRLGRQPELREALARYTPPQIKDDVDSPPGRILLTVWQLVRWELQLRSYDRGTAAAHVLKQRIPLYDHACLARFYRDETKKMRLTLCDYLHRLARMNVDLLIEMNIFAKTAEMARVYGIQFEEVLSRGSQFRVESMLLRLAHEERVFAPTVTPSQRNRMCAPEQLQLVMEPESSVYFEPVIVLDFQSLYPSMAIAYNYCFSTCVGKVCNLERLVPGEVEEGDGSRQPEGLFEPEKKGEIELGALGYKIPIASLVRLTANRQVHVSPLGTSFVKQTTREGLIPKMMREVLSARIMVKQAAKKAKSKRLARVLDARQLALKLVANVTYGYTAANWSGRMPCVEVADAILGKGRETLERAIRLVNEGDYGGGHVIYGDTDSLFVRMPHGTSLTEAFAVGRRIVDDVSRENPAPVVLKLEKVYMGCVLQTKKRYAGWAFESENDTGKLDAKGIECIRRDTCPIVAKTLEKSLELIFARDFDGLERFLDSKLRSLPSLPYTDFLFCKEFRGNYSSRASVPQAKIADQLLATCPAAVPLHGERVAYVIVDGPPEATVYSCVRSAHQFIRKPSERIHFAYYTTAHIVAALRRVLSLLPARLQTFHFTPKPCATPLCVRPSPLSAFCDVCSLSPDSHSLVLLHIARETRVIGEAWKMCTRCIGERPRSLMSCGNFACVVHQLISGIYRDPTRIRLRKHPLQLNSLPRRLEE